MKVLIAPLAFKGTFSAQSVAALIKQSVLRFFPHAQVTLLPLADGGDGTVDVFLSYNRGLKVDVEATGPFGQIIHTQMGILDHGPSAIIEVAKVCGLSTCADSDCVPEDATSLGVGELIKHAFDRHIQTVLIGLGGSATNDGGIGLVHAMGGRFYDAAGRELPPIARSLSAVDTIDLENIDKRLKQSRIIALCDVDNPLVGDEGATMVYGRQKGITDLLGAEKAMRSFAQVIEKTCGAPIQTLPRGGASGGIAAALYYAMSAELKSGITFLLDSLDFNRLLADADLVITAEGQIDRQTIYGKGLLHIAQRSKDAGKKVIAVAGHLGAGSEEVLLNGVDQLIGLSASEEIIDDEAEFVKRLSEKLIM